MDYSPKNVRISIISNYRRENNYIKTSFSFFTSRDRNIEKKEGQPTKNNIKL